MQIDVLIVTAADGEDAAARAVVNGAIGPWRECLDKPRGFEYPLWYCEFRRAQSKPPMRVVLARCPDQREHSTAGIAAPLIVHFNPFCIAMCGVCAGRPEKVNLGDVIIASSVWKYDQGEVVRASREAEAEFHPEVETYQLHKPWRIAAESFSCSLPPAAKWYAERPVSKDGTPWTIRVGAIATGKDLVRDATLWEHIAKTQNRKVLGIEMEASAIGWLAEAYDVRRKIIVKAAMDFGQPDKSDKCRTFAAHAAAEVLIQFLRIHLDNPEDEEPVVHGSRGMPEIYSRFARSPLSPHIRVREFKTLVRERTRDFVGREFILRALDERMDSDTFLSGYIIISGEPGIGKTALVAQLVETRGYVHHFNSALQNIRTARDFLENVCAQLIVRYELDYNSLPAHATEHSGFLSMLLEEAVAKSDGETVVILIDALDEADDLSLPPDVNRLYLPPALPDGVAFVVTTRNEYDPHLSVDTRHDISLDEDDPNNLADIGTYIHRYIEEHRVLMLPRIREWHIEQEEFVTILAKKSQGNFMYLVHVLRDIRGAKIAKATFDDLHNLPAGLRAYYQTHWRAMKGLDSSRFENLYQPVVCMLATVQEPVSISDLAVWTKLAPAQIKEVIEEWHEFLNVDRSDGHPLRYRVYHASFQEFLKEEVGLEHYHNLIVQAAFDKIEWNQP